MATRIVEKHTLVFEFGGNLVKELLSTLTSDERCGVMLEFEDASPDKFAQLVTDAPNWTKWIA